MSRDAIRDMKTVLRAANGSQAVEAALALLEHSVRMRHRRLAVQRLNAAVAVGARVPDEHWRYCREAAAASRDSQLQGLFVACAQVAQASLEGARHG